MTPIEKIMQAAPVIPVLVIEDAAHAQAIARALVAGGLPVLEVTLRTDAALDAIVEMKRVPGAIVGAGTVVDVAGLESAIAAGAEFIVSPGLTDSLGKAAIAKNHTLSSRYCHCGRYHARLGPWASALQIFPR